MKLKFLNILLSILVVGFIAGCGSSGGGGSDPDEANPQGEVDLSGGIGDDTTSSNCYTFVELDSLAQDNKIGSKNGEFVLIISIGDGEALIQHAAGGSVVWQSLHYKYSVSGTTVTFTRGGDEFERLLDENLSQPGAVIPEKIVITFDNNVVKAGDKFTYDGVEYTVSTAFKSIAQALNLTCN